MAAAGPVRPVTARNWNLVILRAPPQELQMYDSPIRVGDRVLITTEQGEEEAVVTRIVQGAAKAGVWVVETSEHGRVVIMRKRDDSANEWI